MARREETGLSIELPDDWTDRTIVTYTAPPRDGETVTPAMVVSRDDIEPTESLQTYTDRHLLTLSSQLENFQLVDSGKRTIGEGNYPALFLRFLWNAPYGPVEQVLIIAETMGVRGRETRCFSTTGLAKDAALDRPRFEEILRTVRLSMQKGPPSTPQGPPPPSSRIPLPPASLPPSVPMPGYRGDRKR
jgi:hypothetical protein